MMAVKTLGKQFDQLTYGIESPVKNLPKEEIVEALPDHVVIAKSTITPSTRLTEQTT